MSQNIFPYFENPSKSCPKKNGESGFSLVEVIVAMVILLIALLGVFAVFTYSVN